jgi:hypothetical protein
MTLVEYIAQTIIHHKKLGLLVPPYTKVVFGSGIRRNGTGWFRP